MVGTHAVPPSGPTSHAASGKSQHGPPEVWLQAAPVATHRAEPASTLPGGRHWKTSSLGDWQVLVPQQVLLAEHVWPWPTHGTPAS